MKRILLTGDDGYNAMGTRLLIHFLKKDFDLTVAGTITQQSGVGGYLSAKDGGRYEEGEIDGVPALLVDGHPVDAVELAKSWFDRPFDLVISGINWGANVGGSFISSGTMSAALRSLTLELTKQAVAISWSLPSLVWHEAHNGDEDIIEFLKHPGSTADRVIRYCMKHAFWGVPFVNINLPEEASSSTRFTKLLPDITQYYKYPMIIDRTAKRFAYPNALSARLNRDVMYDAGAILSGHIAISLCQRDIGDHQQFEKYKDIVHQLP